MSDRSAYYGGYSLYRGNQANAPQAQQAPTPARAVPAFHNDWMMNNNSNNAAAAQRGVLPLLRNFFMPMPGFAQPAPVAPAPQSNANGNFYKGAPLTRATTAGGNNSHSSHPTHHAVAHENPHKVAAKPTVAPKARQANKVLRQASDTWGAFDGIAPLSSTDRQVDPIGTPAPRSVWAGTPADTKPSSGSMAFSLWGGGTQGGLWKPPSLQKWVAGALDSEEVDPALLDKATKQSMLGWMEDGGIQAMHQALTTEPSVSKGPAPICDAPTLAATAAVDSDDEWFDHLQESVDRAMRQQSLDVATLKNNKGDKEWLQHQLPQGL